MTHTFVVPNFIVRCLVYMCICLFIIYLFIVIMLNPAIKKSFKMNVGFTDSLYSINDNN